MAELTDAARAFLGEPRFATVATNDGTDAPQMSVVWYELQGDVLSFSTGTGNRKYRNIEANPRVSVCVEDGYRYVVLRGTATFEHDADAVRADIEGQATRYLGPEQGPGMAAMINGSPHVLVRVAVDHVTVYGFDGQP